MKPNKPPKPTPGNQTFDVNLNVTIQEVHVHIHHEDSHEAATITFKHKGKEINMTDLTDTQQVSVSLVIKDAKGRPAKVDGVPTWKSSDPAVATVNDVAADGMSATVKAVDVGVCQVQVDADADLGAGVKDITGFLDVNVTGGGAVTIELTAGAPAEQI